MSTVCEILKNKNQNIIHIGPNKTAHKAMQLMANKKIGALVVVEQGKMIGIISERHYPRRAKSICKPLWNVLVKDIMSTRVVYVTPSDTIERCIELIVSNRVRHLPVLENEEILGIISIGDLSKIQSAA